MPTALLNASQYKQFQTNGVVPTFEVNGQQIPAFSMGAGNNSGFSAGKNWKLFPDSIDYTDLWYLYKRCDIAANAVDLTPAAVWGKGWTIKVHNDVGTELKESDLEKSVLNLNKSVNVRGYFEEAHRYARCLGLGIIVMGLADDLDLSEPVESASELSYLSSFSSDEVTDIFFDKDPQSSEYGKIESYEITVGGDSKNKFVVHNSRVIHITEKTVKKNARGVSVLESSYDLFQILKNTDWAAGEAYYQNASPLYNLSWDDTVTPTGSVSSEPTAAEKQQIKADLEDLHVKKRFIKPKSWSLEVVQGSGHIADPQMIWSPIIERIAGAVGTPKQLLLGTSAGALASGETNLADWYGKTALRQTGWAEPLLNMFYSRLQTYGVLPEGNIDIEWPSQWEMDAKEKAEIKQIQVNTAVAAVGAPSALGVSGSAVMTLEEAREQILGLTPQLGGGQQQQIQTNAPDTQSKPTADHAALTKKLSVLVERASGKRLVSTLTEVPVIKQDLTPEEAQQQADVLIGEYAAQREVDAIQYLAQRTGQSIKTLPPEMILQLQSQRDTYMKDFKKILADSLE